MKEYIKEMTAKIQHMARNSSRAAVFRDYIALLALKLSVKTDPVHSAERQSSYEDLARRYSESNQNDMDDLMQLTGRIVTHYADNNQTADFLGEIFMSLEIAERGQVFTPHSVSRLCVKLAGIDRDRIVAQGFVTLSEPSCGAGSMVLAYAQTMLEEGFNYYEQLVARAVDIDIRCVHMAYAQLSLFGVPAVVIHGNTLTCEEYSRWYTPMYILGNWIWKQPMGITGGFCASDEKLRRLLNPAYGIIMREKGIA